MQTQNIAPTVGRIIKSQSIATSEKVRAHIDRKRISAPLIVEGISESPEHIKLMPESFALLDVDPAYQRGRTSEIPKLIAVLQAGGAILTPIICCRRPWSNEPTKLWIVDGHQRACAFQELRIPMPLQVHQSESMEAESAFFLACNKKLTISPNHIVYAWRGAGAEMVRRASSNESHPLLNRVNFGRDDDHRHESIGATTLVQAVLTSSTGVKANGQTQTILARTDAALAADAHARARAEHVLRLIGLLFQKSSAPTMVVRCLAAHSYRAWTDGEISMPSHKIIVKLRQVNWKEEFPLIEKFAPSVAAAIAKLWPI